MSRRSRRPARSCEPASPGLTRSEVTLGIDLSAQPAGTAACRLLWGRDEVTALSLESGLDDDALTILRDSASSTAIDAPFGWPNAYVAAVSQWQTARAWPRTEPRQLRYRATDLDVQERTGIWPLSPSSDRIAVCAWRCANLLAGWGVRDLIGGAENTFEAYPAAALQLWQLPWRGYKAQSPQARTRTSAVRTRIVAELQTACPWLALTSDQWRACEAEHDLLDALVCALVARAAAVGATIRPGPSVAAMAAVEGWIQLPAAAVSELAAAR